MHRILITGGTGYLGRALVPALLERKHLVRLLVRPESQHKVPPGVEVYTGDPLNPMDVGEALRGMDTVVHLVGVPKPSPLKAKQFRAVDLVSLQATVRAIETADPQPHLVYVSVAQPAPVMKAYVQVRAEAEALIRAKNLRATILRPWYILGPGHRWPYLLIPLYALLRLIPVTRDSAERLGLVTLAQMTHALVGAVERSTGGIFEVPALRS